MNQKNIKCEICQKDLLSLKALSQHIRFHNISTKEYYDKFLIKKDENVCKTCGKETKFKSISEGYQKFCNLKCSNNNENTKNIIRKKVKNRWNNIEYKKNIKNKISNTVKNIWKDQNSKYNSFEYKNKLIESRKELNLEKRNNFIKEIINNSNFLVIDDYKNAGSMSLFQCKKCNNKFESLWNYIQQGKKCPYCEKNTSKSEDELRDFISSFGFKIIEKSKKIIPPKELDIYIPDLNIAIEYNGLYWHSEQNIKDSNYHLQKTKECNELGIHLIHIFEDEWIFKKEIVKNRLMQILKVKKDKKTIFARNCIIKEIDSSTKNEFLDKFHIQGKDNSIIKLGAFYNNELVSVMTFGYGNISKGSKKENFVWELNRFCSDYNYHIPGIASKLLSYFKKNFEWKKIFSYSDIRWSKGNLYYKLGFNLVEQTKPNYWYLSNYKRIHRFNFRKRNNEPKDIPEWILRQKEGYFRIWDCGNLKFELNNKNLMEVI